MIVIFIAKSFIVYIKAGDIYKGITEDVKTRFDTSKYELDTPLPNGKNKKVIGLMKDGLGGKNCWIKLLDCCMTNY